MGYRQDRLPLLSRRAARSAMVLTGLGVLLLIGVYFVVDPPTDVMPPEIALASLTFHDVRVWMQDYLFSKVDLGLGRLIASAVGFTFMFFAVTIFWRPIQRAFNIPSNTPSNNYELRQKHELAMYGFAASRPRFHSAGLGAARWSRQQQDHRRRHQRCQQPGECG